MKMNRLELALLDASNMQLDLYLEDEVACEIRAHIEEIRKRAAMSTDAGRMKEAIMGILSDNTKDNHE
tara:strand:+ start:296 stop:499 length:204 start_codon:yes stop_codon:yes gene_type:complete